MKTRCDVRNAASCTGCGACRSACALGALRMERDDDGFLYPRIDRSRCTRCGACQAVCPVDRGSPAPWLSSFAARCTDEEIRASSSSGGVFTLLAEDTLARGGIAFGAALFWDGEPALRHIGVEDVAGLAALRGSKYLQSDPGETFAQAKAALNAGREVLYCGAPCQVAGLYAALKGRRDNLLTVDLVCHRAPSPMVFAAYVRWLEAKHGQKVRALSFRDKRQGWKDFCIAATFADGSEYVGSQTEDPYMIAFLRNFCLRPVCHACPFAGEKRQADLTLADLWGAQRLLPQQDDDRGLSLVLVNSEAGARALEAARDRLWMEPMDAMACVRYNPSIVRPSQAPLYRGMFMRHVRRKGFKGVERFYRPQGFWRKWASKAAHGVLKAAQRAK